jgi:hypothetical protein
MLIHSPTAGWTIALSWWESAHLHDVIQLYHVTWNSTRRLTHEMSYYRFVAIYYQITTAIFDYVDNNSTPTMVSKLLEAKHSLF